MDLAGMCIQYSIKLLTPTKAECGSKFLDLVELLIVKKLIDRGAHWLRALWCIILNRCGAHHNTHHVLPYTDN